MFIKQNKNHSQNFNLNQGKNFFIFLNSLVIFTLICIFHFSNSAYANSFEDINASFKSPEEKGRAIAVEMRKRSSNYHDLEANIKIQIVENPTRIKKRQLITKILEGKDLGDKTLNTFVSPPDQKGVALLTHSHKSKNNEQWLYLPAIKRVKKIAYQTQTSPFMGTEFTYEDIAPVEIEKYTYQFIQERKVGEELIFFVEQVPLEPGSGYSKQIQWIDQEFRLRKVEFYNKENILFKTMTLSGYQYINNLFWHPQFMIMTNHSSGFKTVLQWQNYKINTGLKDFDFTTLSLKRTR